MPELMLQRTGATLIVTLGEYTASIPLGDVVPDASTWQRIYDDAPAYGRNLFDRTFPDEQFRALLSDLPAGERLVLLADDPLVAANPWEYLRDSNDKLLVSRLNFVRSISSVSAAQRQAGSSFTGALEIIAIPVSPVDETRVLDVEREWKNLIQVVSTTTPPRALTVRRVRPPTRRQLERSLSRQRTSIVHFMGHSSGQDGKVFLSFEDARARRHLVDAADFADSLGGHVLLVVLNSCLSAIVAPTEFGNIARTLVRRGFPYALGMQCFLPDDAALVLSQALYDFLLQRRSVEDAVMHTRRALEEPGILHNPSWLAGIPVLYTCLREQPAPPLQLTYGQPTIQPDPERLQKTFDLAALPEATHFVGRGEEISAALDLLLAPGAHSFVLLHGLGGIGKTALARAVAERVSYSFADRVLAVSFETFARLDADDRCTVNETFADRFYNRLAHFYGLDPARYSTAVELQQAILQWRTHHRSLLVLDNIETLIDAQRQDDPAAKSLATFISRLREGDGAVLLTSRIVPPSDWGDCHVVEVPGITNEAGADLFLALLPTDRRHLAPPAARLALSQRVQGHPLSIRLLAGRFADETATDLTTFLTHIEIELERAEQTTPTSLEDLERQKTLYACMAYSVKRLSPQQRQVLDAVSIFQAPFPPEFAAYLLDNEEQAPLHLQNLVRLGLLNRDTRTFQEGELTLLALHPMLRWYIQHHLSDLDADVLERYGQVFDQLARQSYQSEGGYDQSSLIRYLVRQSLPDLEAALHYLSPVGRSSLAYHLATPYQRLGQNRRALALYEETLELNQELGNVRSVAVTQNAMATVLSQLGQPQAALALYEQSLHTTQQLGDIREVAVTQASMATVLSQLGQPQAALVLYEQALHAKQQLGDIREAAAMQASMADVLSQMGRPQEALVLYEQALHTKQQLGDIREAAAMQASIAKVLSQMGRPQEALTLYEQALSTEQQLGDIREVAETQHAMADVLRHLGQPQAALALYEQSLRTTQQLGDIRGVAVTQNAMATVLSQLGQPQEALALYEQSLRTTQQLGDIRGVAVTQGAMATVLSQLGQPQEALALYEQALHTKQLLGDVREIAATQYAIADVLKLKGKPQEALALYERTLRTYQELGDLRSVAATQHAIADVLRQLGQPQAALALYEQSLHTTQQLGDIRGVAVTHHAMADVLQQLGKSQEALVLYEQTLHTYQELGDLRSVAVAQANFCQLLLQQGEHRRALPMAWEAYNGLSQHGFAYDAQIMQQLLISIKGKVLGTAQFDTLWEQVMSEPQLDWLRKVQAGPSDEQSHISSEQLKVIVSNTVTVMTVMPEKRDEWRETMTETLQKAQNSNQSQGAELFLAILAVLDGQAPSLPEGHPYTDALNAVQAGIAAGGPHKDVLPFGSELIPRSIAALLGSPQQKLAHAQYLTAQATETIDEGMQALIRTIQLALFEKDLSQLGHDLHGIYRQAWETIAIVVETGGVDPHLFDFIINNTLAVLGPSSHHRSEWRNNLAAMRNQATAQGIRHLVTLLDAVIGLLNAGGNPTGLGEGLKGIYAKTWQAIVERPSS